MSPPEHLGAVVVGAGCIGLAVGAELARRGREVIVLERHDQIGSEMSSRSSEVIHAGLYYPEGSLKARLCTRGRELLYRYCEGRSVPYRRCGKLVVAVDEAQRGALRTLATRATANGVPGLRWLEAAEARALEPELACRAALLSPWTGIFDSHAFMLACRADLEAAGGLVALDSTLESAAPTAAGFTLVVRSCGGTATELCSDRLVNAAGLAASEVAARVQGYPAAFVPRLRYAKGTWFSYAGRSPFSRLIYPLPEPAGLGIHATLDLAGALRFGPDVQWVEAPDYAVDEGRAGAFYQAIRRYWRGLPDGRLAPAYAGVRPKLAGPGELPADFLVHGPAEHGIRGLVQLYGIESPGLTAALALAEYVADCL